MSYQQTRYEIGDRIYWKGGIYLITSVSRESNSTFFWTTLMVRHSGFGPHGHYCPIAGEFRIIPERRRFDCPQVNMLD